MWRCGKRTHYVPSTFQKGILLQMYLVGPPGLAVVAYVSHCMLALLHPLDSIVLILWPIISTFKSLQCLLYSKMAQVIVHLLKYCVLQSSWYTYLRVCSNYVVESLYVLQISTFCRKHVCRPVGQSCRAAIKAWEMWVVGLLSGLNQGLCISKRGACFDHDDLRITWMSPW